MDETVMLKGLHGPTPGVSTLIQQSAAKYGIDPNLLTAIAQQESGLNQGAVSPAGAIGVMQLMPGTAAQYGANPNDAAQNVDAGAHYFSDMLNQYSGNVSLALAAYNAGPGNVAKYGGVPPFTETQNYVASIESAAGIDPNNPYQAGATPDPAIDPNTGLPVDTSNSGDAAGAFGLSTNGIAMVGIGVGAAIVLWAFGAFR